MVVSGSLAGRPSLAIGSGGEVRIAGGPGTSLEVAGLSVDLVNGARLDLGSGRIDVASGGITEAELLAGLAAGRGDGSWGGLSGIGSSSAAADIAANGPRSLGWIQQGDGGFVIAYAAPGDTNIDNNVDILDAGNFLAGADPGAGRTGRWSSGDFNYDGLVDILDIGDFMSTGLFDTGDYLGGSATAAVAAVPEPGAGFAVALAATCWWAGWIRRRGPQKA